MNEDPQFPAHAVIDQLVERIASLELEVAVLKAMLSQIKPEIVPTEKESLDETGQYL